MKPEGLKFAATGKLDKHASHAPINAGTPQGRREDAVQRWRGHRLKACDARELVAMRWKNVTEGGPRRIGHPPRYRLNTGTYR